MNRLELRDIAKSYDIGMERVRAVDGVTLTLEPGELVAIYGPSGSGKSTLLMLAAGLLEPDRGQIVFGGVDISHLPARKRAAHRLSLGFVFQAFQLMPGVSAADNATLKLLAEGWKPRRAREQAQRWLEVVGLDSRSHQPPERLSMGECQRVAIARALANEPRLILADEPTGSLDTARSGEILELLSRIARERRVGVLLATHDPEAARFADRVFELRDGQLRDRASSREDEHAAERDRTGT
ncbi:MAG TPA: ABC transporter ATP-binding protein [Conexibacter sp.]|nr:ABC transporter ATP-binding protein [Conexibacter sp.]